HRDHVARRQCIGNQVSNNEATHRVVATRWAKVTGLVLRAFRRPSGTLYAKAGKSWFVAEEGEPGTGSVFGQGPDASRILKHPGVNPDDVEQVLAIADGTKLRHLLLDAQAGKIVIFRIGHKSMQIGFDLWLDRCPGVKFRRRV